MAQLKVFVSSTCYDLSMVRAELRSFISNFGHEPVMSDYNDVLFDPRDHTHESCIKEIVNSDVIVLIIGSRFGGTAIPRAVNQIDIEKLKSLSRAVKMLQNPESISITQMEILRAIELDIPIFTFVDSKVFNDHLIYEKNKDKTFINEMDFASIEKRETAVYIFEFINFLRLRAKNNSVFEFTKISDIEDAIKKQWSALLQRLLSSQREKINNKRQSKMFLDGINDIKSLILTTISTVDGKEIGKGVLRYRHLIEFFQSFQIPNLSDFLKQNILWSEILKQLEIEEVVTLNSDTMAVRRFTYFVKTNGTFYECRNMIGFIRRLSKEWNLFRQLENGLKENIIGAIVESEQGLFHMIRFKDIQFKEFISDLEKERGTTFTMTTNNPITFDESQAETQYQITNGSDVGDINDDE